MASNKSRPELILDLLVKASLDKRVLLGIGKTVAKHLARCFAIIVIVTGNLEVMEVFTGSLIPVERL